VKLEHAIALAGLIVLLCAVSAATWLIARHYYAPDQIDEKPAAMVWHDDGSLTAMRDPAGAVDLPETSAPEGGTLIRTVEVTIKPTPVPAADVTSVTDDAGAVHCPPVTARLDLRKYDDGVRVSMRSEGGEVLDAIDVPRSVIFVHDVKRNIVGIDIAGDRKTLRYGRAIGPVDLGIQVSEESGRLDQGGWLAFRF